MLTSIAAPPPGSSWREAPEYLALFAPAGRHAGAYRTYVSTLDLESALKALTADAATIASPGAWVARPQLPFDAFGQTGPYNRSSLARLYGSGRPRVARGPRSEGGRVTESWTLVSPYPDAALQRLEPGTLLIVLKLP